MSETEPRAWTADEIRGQFLDHVAAMTRYWLNETRTETEEGRATGLVFSILAALDGSSVGLPGFVVAPAPHPDDEAFHRGEGKNWYPPFPVDGVPCDIAGGLHEHWNAACQRFGLRA